MTGTPTPAEVLTIASMPDVVIRNLRMTDCYWRLSNALVERVGACRNWCTFGTWAARQAGATIRGEDVINLLPEAREGWRWSHPIQSLWRILLRRGLFHKSTLLGRLVHAVHSPFDAVERASAAVAEGNRRIFSEMAYHHARYLAEVPPNTGPDDPAFHSFLGGLTDGEPPDGQRCMRQAFTRYQSLTSLEDPALRSQTICLASLEFGAHEQMRVQQLIADALEVMPVTVEDLTRRLLRVLGTVNPVAVMLLPLARFVAVRYGKFARAVTRAAITRSMMTLHTPVATFVLSRHIDRIFPPEIANVRVPDLAALIARFEPPDTAECVDCGATDWSNYMQRMHYISHLFRVLHTAPEMRTAPFTPQQTALISRNLLPDGLL